MVTVNSIFCLFRRNEFQLTDSVQYFLNNIDRISSIDYVPTLQDILYCRKTTKGVIETRIAIDRWELGLLLTLTDSISHLLEFPSSSLMLVVREHRGRNGSSASTQSQVFSSWPPPRSTTRSCWRTGRPTEFKSRGTSSRQLSTTSYLKASLSSYF